MADHQPVTISFLKLPPDEQPYFKIKEMLQEFLQKINHLVLVLYAVQDPPSPEIWENLRGVQRAAGDQCRKASSMAENSRRFADTLAQFIESLPLSSTNEETQEIVSNIPFRARDVIERCDEGEKGMETFRQELTAAVPRITRELEKSPNADGDANLVFTAENSQIINELVQASKYSGTSYRQIKEYFQEVKKHFEDIESPQTGSPSEDEMNMTRQRWSAFSESMVGLKELYRDTGGKIIVGPDVTTARRLGYELDAQDLTGNSNPPNSSTPPPTKRAIMNTTSPTSSPETSPSFVISAVSWLRRTLRRLISCLTLNYFK